MTAAGWAVVIIQGAIIVGLVLLYWRTRDEREAAANISEFLPRSAAANIYVGPGREYETISAGLDAAQRAIERGEVKSRTVYRALDHIPKGATFNGVPLVEITHTVKMPASDRRVLEGLADRDDAESARTCADQALIASLAGVQDTSARRVIARLVAGGFIRPCGLDRGAGWFLTDAGLAVRKTSWVRP